MLDAPDALRLANTADGLADRYPAASHVLRSQAGLWREWAITTRRPPGRDSSLPDSFDLTDYLAELRQVSLSTDAGAAALADSAIYRIALLELDAARHLELPRPATIVSVTPSGRDAAEIHLRLDGEVREADIPRAGQHLGVMTLVGGVVLRRSYSICRPPQWVRDSGTLSIAVRSHPHGLVSPKLISRTAAGEKLLISGPQGVMTSDVLPPGPRSVVLIAAGSGLTPLTAIAAEALTTDSRTTVVLIVIERSEHDVMLASVINELASQYPFRFTPHILETRGALGRRRPDTLTLSTLVKELHGSGTIDAAFICGPDILAEAAAEAISNLGVQPEHIHRESFGTGQTVIPNRPGGITTVIVDGKSTELKVEPGETLLVASLIAGLSVPFSCLAGACGTCRIHVADGAVAPHSPDILGSAADADGWVLACQAAPV